MLKFLKWVFIISLSLFLSCSFNLWARAASPTESFNLPVILKMGRYYVLYTYPKPPYIDPQNRLIVPLGTVCRDLIGAKVNYNPQTKTAIINWSSRTVELTVGSKTAYVNKKQVVLDTFPILYKNSMLVPLRILIEGLGIKATWNSEYRFVHLDDERILKTRWILLGPEDSPALRIPALDENAFFPLFCKIEIYYPVRTPASTKIKLDITAKNITGKSIPEGKADVRPHVFFDDGGYSTAAFFGSEGKPLPVKPPVKAREIIEISEEHKSDIPVFDVPKCVRKVHYVLLTCRVNTV
jgi:hypothetical protein